jgi:hypothetical protein
MYQVVTVPGTLPTLAVLTEMMSKSAYMGTSKDSEVQRDWMNISWSWPTKQEVQDECSESLCVPLPTTPLGRC